MRFASFLRIDPFLVALVATVSVASLLPAKGSMAAVASDFSDLAIALLFFLHGAKLTPRAVIAGVRAWPIHIMVVVATFAMFPLLGIAAKHLADLWLNPAIGAGLLLLCIMPSTVQSSVAFTSLARGNVPAAVTSASLSTILGVVLTPALATLLLSGRTGPVSFGSYGRIALQLLAPFVLGQMLRPVLIAFLDKYRKILSVVDRGAILSVVYTAFSAAVVQGLWRRYSASDLIWTLGLDSVILAVALSATIAASRLLGLRKEDEIAVVFCGSKKSLVSGVPIASAIFPLAQVGPMILPLMLFHQIQLMACAILAQRYAARQVEVNSPAAAGKAVAASS